MYLYVKLQVCWAMSVEIQCCQIPCTKSGLCVGTHDFLLVRECHVFRTYVGVCSYAAGPAPALSLAQRTGKVMRSPSGWEQGSRKFNARIPLLRKHSVTVLRSGSSLSPSADILSALLLPHSCTEGAPGPRDCIELVANNMMPVTLFSTWNNSDNRAKSH